MAIPSTFTEPLVQSYKRETKLTIVDFPEPVFPRIAMVLPASTEKLIPFRASIFVSS